MFWFLMLLFCSLSDLLAQTNVPTTSKTVPLQIPQLFCYKIKPYWCHLRPLGSPEFPWRQPKHVGYSLGRDGQAWDDDFIGSRRKVLRRRPLNPKEGMLTMSAVTNSNRAPHTQCVSEQEAFQRERPKILTFHMHILLVHYHRIWKKPCKVVTLII